MEIYLCSRKESELFCGRLEICYCKKHLLVSPEQEICAQPQYHNLKRYGEIEREHQEQLEVKKMWLRRNGLVLFWLRDKTEKDMIHFLCSLNIATKRWESTILLVHWEKKVAKFAQRIFSLGIGRNFLNPGR